MSCIFSIDVEDWYHILDTPAAPPASQWESLPSRVESNFFRLLELLHQYHAPATCFFLGAIARRFPHLVRAAAACGHEVASHGFSHQLVYRMKPKEFVEDAARARRLIEDIAGRQVLGYRAPGFSVTDETPWFFDALIEAGYAYDSSVFPGRRAHGGLPSANRRPYRYLGRDGALIEFPVTVADAAGRGVCLFGGGYLRLFPLWLVMRAARRIASDSQPVVFYVHPREVDPRHPRLAMSASRRFKCYVNLSRTESKLRRLLAGFEFTTFRDYAAGHFPAGEKAAAAVAGGTAC
jgi:polysaccharide deacetylase family protein (PEP-CTERM system associated)